MPATVLQVEGLRKAYGALVAVKDLSLEIYEGEVFGFLGAGIGDVAYELAALVVLSGLYFGAGVWLFRRRHLRPA